MKKKFASLIITSLLTANALHAIAAPGESNATDLSYTYASVRYITQDLDRFNCTQDGLSISGSYDLQGGVFAEAAFTDVSGDNCGSSSTFINAGYHLPYSERFDIYGTLGLEDISPDVGNGDSGVVAAIGMRGYLNRQLEVKIEAFNRTTFDGDTGINTSAVFSVTPQLNAVLDLGFTSDVTTAAVGLRYNF